jgi:hypothetical protein
MCSSSVVVEVVEVDNQELVLVELVVVVGVLQE